MRRRRSGAWRRRWRRGRWPASADTCAATAAVVARTYPQSPCHSRCQQSSCRRNPCSSKKVPSRSRAAVLGPTRCELAPCAGLSLLQAMDGNLFAQSGGWTATPPGPSPSKWTLAPASDSAAARVSLCSSTLRGSDSARSCAQALGLRLASATPARLSRVHGFAAMGLDRVYGHGSHAVACCGRDAVVLRFRCNSARHSARWEASSARGKLDLKPLGR